MKGLNAQSPAHEKCLMCEGKGFIGTAYYDDEIEWMIYGSDGRSCPACEGCGDAIAASSASHQHSAIV